MLSTEELLRQMSARRAVEQARCRHKNRCPHTGSPGHVSEGRSAWHLLVPNYRLRLQCFEQWSQSLRRNRWVAAQVHRNVQRYRRQLLMQAISTWRRQMRATLQQEERMLRAELSTLQRQTHDAEQGMQAIDQSVGTTDSQGSQEYRSRGLGKPLPTNKVTSVPHANSAKTWRMNWLR